MAYTDGEWDGWQLRETNKERNGDKYGITLQMASHHDDGGLTPPQRY